MPVERVPTRAMWWYINQSIPLTSFFDGLNTTGRQGPEGYRAAIIVRPK